MIGFKIKGFRGESSTGFAWPNSPSGVGQVGDPFGPRPFSPHIATVGYDYDFHRGIDLEVGNGDPIYSPATGAVIRHNYTHFEFEDAVQLDEFVLRGTGNLAVSHSNEAVQLTCTRDGIGTFPTVDSFQAKTEKVAPTTNDWVMEVSFTGISLVGGIGIAIINQARTKYVGLEYNGTTFTIRGVGTSTFAQNGATFASSGQTWMRITYTVSTGTFTWLRSTDGLTWTTLVSETGQAFSDNGPSYTPEIYWRSGDTSVTPYTVEVQKVNWNDLSQTIGRFGNWLEIGIADKKFALMHFRTLAVRMGQYVSTGQLLGTAGSTGFDTRSGRVLEDHLHLEVLSNNGRDYANAEAINPLDSLLLPRTNVSNNVSVVVTEAADPLGNASWVMTVTVQRAIQDFDLNQFTLTGNLTTRTINWNTRSGLNADNDIPVNSGVYIVPGYFNTESTAYVVAFYFNKTTVGNSLVSYSVLDTQGNILASG